MGVQEKIKKNSWVLLLGRKKSYVVRAKGTFHCEFGKIELEELVGKEYGTEVKTHLGERFVACKPFLTDLLRKTKRKPQVILPREAAIILAKTGVGKRATAIDAGTGSGFLAMFLANYVKKVYTYEKRSEFYEIARENIKLLGFRNIEIKHRDASKGFEEKNVDLVVLDLEKPERIVKHAHSSLKPGGYLAVFCPYAEEVGRVARAMKDRFAEIEIVENMQREWEVSFDRQEQSHLRAKPYLTFTGFIVFGRKIL